MRDTAGPAVCASSKRLGSGTMMGVIAIGRVRHWLDDHLFPDAPSSPQITRRQVLVFGGLTVVMVGIQLARMWPSAPLNSIWGEDGSIWLADAMNRGFSHAVTLPYNGYLETLSRLVAEPVSAMPADWFAPVMAISGTAIVTGCAFVVWRASAGHIHNPYLRATLTASMVLLPVAGVETLDNVTNSMWFLLFASFWLLLWRPATFAPALGAAGLLFVSTITHGGALLLAPLWVLRLIAIRDRRDKVIVAGYGIGMAVQVALSWSHLNSLGEGTPTHLGPLAQAYVNYVSTPQWHWNLVPAYLQRVVGGAVPGQRITGFLWVHLRTTLEVVLRGALIALVTSALMTRNPRTRLIVPLAVATSLATFLISGYQRWTSAGHEFLWPHGTSNAGNSHYMVVPTLLLFSAVFLQLDARPWV